MIGRVMYVSSFKPLILMVVTAWHGTDILWIFNMVSLMVVLIGFAPICFVKCSLISVLLLPESRNACVAISESLYVSSPSQEWSASWWTRGQAQSAIVGIAFCVYLQTLTDAVHLHATRFAFALYRFYTMPIYCFLMFYVTLYICVSPQLLTCIFS